MQHLVLTVPPDKLEKEELSKAARKQLRFDELHVILSTDHGQVASRCNIILLRIATHNLSIKFEKHMLVGHTECRKDT